MDSHDSIFDLEHTIGNQAVQSLMRSNIGIQLKLKVSQPSDVYEQEADRVTEHVMPSGQPAVVRPFEYIIGRLNGNFHTPKDPLMDRRWKGDDLVLKVLADSAHQPPKINDRYTQTQPKTGGNTVDFTEKMLEQRLKFEELKMLYNKYYRPEDVAQMFLSVANLGDENFLDKKLDWLRRWDNLKSGSQSPIANSLEFIERVARPLPPLFLAPGLYGAPVKVGFSDGRNILGYNGHVCNKSLSWEIGEIHDDVRRLLKSNHICDPQKLQKAQSVTDIPGISCKRRQELIFYLTLIVNDMTKQHELVDLTAVEVTASVFDIRLNNYEECIDLDSLESVTLAWVYGAAKEGKTMINRIDLQEFLVIFEGTLGFFRLTIDGVKRYFFVYIAKGLEPRDIKYLKKFPNTYSPITTNTTNENPTQPTESGLPGHLKGVNPGRPVDLTNITRPSPAGPTNKTIPTPTQTNKTLSNSSTSTTTTTQPTNTLPFNNSNPNLQPTEQNNTTTITLVNSGSNSIAFLFLVNI